MVEQRIRNARVGGSIPLASFTPSGDAPHPGRGASSKDALTFPGNLFLFLRKSVVGLRKQLKLDRETPPRSLWPQTLLILCAVFLAFSPVLRPGFLQWDDTTHLLYNPFVYSLSWDHVGQIFQQTINNTYVPLTVLSFTVEHHFFGMNPGIFHWTNLLLHLFNTALVTRIGLKLGLSPRAAVLAAFLFAAHPLRVESVAWITERKDVLYAAFYLSSVSLYLNYLKKNAWGHYAGSLACGVAAVLSKPMAMSLPWILLLFDGVSGRKFSRRMVLDKIPFFVMIEPLAWITAHSLGKNIQFIFPDSFGYFIWSFSFYIPKHFFPLQVFPLYVPPPPLTSGILSYLPAAGVFAAFWTALLVLRKNRWFAFACWFYAGSMFFLWRWDVADMNFVADRFIYLPGLGWTVWLGYLIDKGLTRARGHRFYHGLALGCLAVVLGGMMIKTFLQARLWRSDKDLWAYTLKYRPDNAVAQKKFLETRAPVVRSGFDFSRYEEAAARDPNNPEVYYRRGLELFNHRHLALAFADFNRCLALNPRHAGAHIKRGQLSAMRQDVNAALRDYDQALVLNPRDAAPYLNKGILFFEQGEVSLARDLIEQAISLEATSSPAYFYRGRLYAQESKFESAAAAYDQSIKLSKSFIDAYRYRAAALVSLAKHAAAIEDYRTILELNPGDDSAANELGVLYLGQKEEARAMDYFSRAIGINPYYKRAYNNRGVAQIRLGHYESALKDFSQAIRLEPTDFRMYITRGDVYYVMGREAAAFRDYQSAIHLAPQQAVGYYKRSQVYQRRGRLSQANRDLETARALGM